MQLRTKLLFACGIAVGLVSNFASAKLTQRAASATFHAIGPAGMSIDGKTDEVTVREEGGFIHTTVAMGNLKTGLDLRDDHVKKHLETDTYPAAELVVAKTALTFPIDGTEVEANVTGSLTLHGAKQDVPVHYVARLDGGGYVVDGSAHLKMSDFKITRPSYLGVTVKDEVDIRVKLQLKDD